MNIKNSELFSSNHLDDKPKSVRKKEEMAFEFEKIFARQLVQEMTKDLFKPDDNSSMMTSGNQLYRSKIVESLSEELAKQEMLGMSEIVLKNWNVETESHEKNR